MNKSVIYAIVYVVILSVAGASAITYLSNTSPASETPSPSPTSNPTNNPTFSPTITPSVTSVPATNNPSTTSPSRTNNPIPDYTPTTVTITDMRNKTMTLSYPIERIVMVPMPDPAIYYAVAGSCDAIVGIHPTSLSAAQESILGKLAPELLTASTSFVTSASGFDVNIEELVKLDPDVVVQWARTDAEIAICEKIEAVGIPVIGIKGGSPGTQAELDAIITIMGELSGYEEKAAELVAFHHSVLDEISPTIATISNEDKPKILYIYSGLRVAGNGTYNDFWIENTGGINVANEVNGWVTATMEQILTWNPDIIYIGNFNTLQPNNFFNNTISGQDWSQVTAVKSGQVYKVPLGAYRWDPANAESPLMFMWLVEKQHPDLFNYNMDQEVKAYFAEFYGYQLSDSELYTVFHPGDTV